MVSQIMSSNFSEQSTSALQQEFLEQFFIQGDDPYPWDPSNPDSEAYFELLEAQYPLAETWSERELEDRASQLLAIAQLQVTANAQDNVKNNLWRRFVDYVPTQQLTAILDRAESLIDSNLAQIGQLVACVQPIWLHWNEEDLRVFARPLAMAMRGSNPVKQAPWNELTEIEQIRLTLLVAQEALNQLSGDRQ